MSLTRGRYGKCKCGKEATKASHPYKLCFVCMEKKSMEVPFEYKLKLPKNKRYKELYDKLEDWQKSMCKDFENAIIKAERKHK